MICKYPENNQLKSDSSFKQLFISPDSSLVFILFLSSYLSWNSVSNRSSAERNPKRYYQLLNLQRAWLYPMLSISSIRSYQQYSRPTDVSDVISWLNEPKDLWNTKLYFKSFCNSNLNGNCLSFELCRMKSTYLVIQCS